MKTIIVTNCTSRKRQDAGNVLHAPRRLPTETLFEFAQRWWEQACQHRGRVHAHELYCGRGYNEAIEAARLAGAPLYTISAGFGLLRPQDQIPPYDFSADLLSGTEARRAWWEAISQARGTAGELAELISEADLCLISLSTRYLDLVEPEMARVAPATLNRVRVISGAQPRGMLADAWLPYDQRLDGPDSDIRGTRADFNPRALRHFVSLLPKATSQTLEAHKRLVEEALVPLRPPAAIKRRQHTDDEIRQLIRELWDDARGRSGVALRLLRDQAGVACEQGRFAELFRQVKASL